jgi:hypothetical protein
MSLLELLIAAKNPKTKHMFPENVKKNLIWKKECQKISACKY